MDALPRIWHSVLCLLLPPAHSHLPVLTATSPSPQQPHVPSETLSGGTGGQGVKGALQPGPCSLVAQSSMGYNQSRCDVVSEGEMNLE